MKIVAKTPIVMLGLLIAAAAAANDNLYPPATAAKAKITSAFAWYRAEVKTKSKP